MKKVKVNKIKLKTILKNIARNKIFRNKWNKDEEIKSWKWKKKKIEIKYINKSWKLKYKYKCEINFLKKLKRQNVQSEISKSQRFK